MTNRELDAVRPPCPVCGAKVPSRNVKYCSLACGVADRWESRTCALCSTVFKARKCYTKRGQMKYCSPECGNKAARNSDIIVAFGEEWSGNAGGYYASMARPKRLLHRETWRQLRGPIPEGYVVHHKDGNKSNNDIVNLEPMEWGEHTSLENRLKWKSGKLKASGRSPCAASGCERLSRCLGLCSMHYQREKQKEKKNVS